ncbi:MAG: hypothetical protein ACLRVN_01210 [Butyricicoccus sp.]
MIWQFPEKKLAHRALARLLTGIFDHLADDIRGIVAMVDKLAGLDLGDITDVINTERKNAFHEDEVIQNSADELIEPMPDFQCGGVGSACCRVRRTESCTLRKTASELSSCSAKGNLRRAGKGRFARTMVEDRFRATLP